MGNARWEGAQTTLARLGESGCLFLCLCSIAEQARGEEIDVMDAAERCAKKRLVNAEDFFVNDSPGVLSELTGRPWTMERREALPDPVPERMFTVEKWTAPPSRTHFKRRGFDTIAGGARTCRAGRIECYYCYTVGGGA